MKILIKKDGVIIVKNKIDDSKGNTENLNEDNYDEEKKNKKIKNVLSNISIFIGVGLIFFAIFLYFTEYKKSNIETVDVKFLSNRINEPDNIDINKEKYTLEQNIALNIINKHIIKLKEKQYNYLFKIRENIYYDIKKYQDKSSDFAKDITDIGSQSKIIWKSTTDFFSKEDKAKEYIEKIYFHYLFDEEDINNIVFNNFNNFNTDFEKNYNIMLSEIVNEIDISGLEILNKKDIEEIIETRLKLENETIDIDKIESGAKIAVLSKVGVFLVSEKILEPLVKKVVTNIIVKLTTNASTKAATVSGGNIGGPIGVGAAIIVSLGVDWLMSSKNKRDIIDRTNSKIEDVASGVSEGIYNEIKNNLEIEFNRILQ